MEKLVKELFSKPIGDNFVTLWFDICNKYDIYELIEKSKTKFDLVIDALILYANLANDIKNYYPNVSMSKSIEIEEALIMVYEKIVDYLNFDTVNIPKALEAIKGLIDKRRLQMFNGKSLGSLLYKMHSYNRLVEKFNHQQCQEYLKLFLNLKIYKDCTNQKEQADIVTYNSKLHEYWSLVATVCVEALTEKQFVENLVEIQNLAELAIIKCRDTTDCPYSSLIGKIVSVRNYIDKCKTIYMTFSKDDKRFLEVLNIIKDVMINDRNNIYYNAMSTYLGELMTLIEQEGNKKGTLYSKYYRQLFELIFEVYIKCKRHDLKQVWCSFTRSVLDVMGEFKGHDADFQLFLIEKLRECVVFVRKVNESNKNQKTKKSEDDESNVKKSESKLFSNFSYWIYSYLGDTCTKKNLASPFLDLLTETLYLSDETECTKLAANIMNNPKGNLFKGKESVEKTIKIVKALAASAEKLEELEDDEIREKNAEQSKKLSENLCKEIAGNFECHTAMQNVILFEIFEKAVKNNYKTLEYFDVIEPFIEILDFESYSTDKGDLLKLKNLVKLAVQPTIFESIQPENNRYYCSRNRSFHKFFEALAKVYQKREDIVRHTESEICYLMDQIDKCDDYEEPNEDPGTMNINFKIIRDFVSNISEENDYLPALVTRLTPIILKLKEKLPRNRDVDSLQYEFLRNAQTKYDKCLAQSASSIWKIHLNEKSGQYAQIVEKIFPHSVQVFTKEFENSFFEKSLNESEQFMSSNIQIYFLIIHHVPSWYFVKQNKYKEVRFVEMLENANRKKNALLMGQIIQLCWKLSTDVQKHSDDIEVFFNNRIKIIDFLNLNKNQNFNEFCTMMKKVHQDSPLFLYYLGTIYSNLGSKIIDDPQLAPKSKAMIQELIEIYKKMKKPEEQIECLRAIKTIASTENRHFLLKEHKSLVETLKKSTNGDIKEIGMSLCDLLEGRNLEVIDEKANQNEKQIKDVKETATKTEKNVKTLNTTVKRQELKVENLSKDVNEINTTVNQVGERLDEHEDHLNVLDDKTLLNVPLWSKKIIPLLKKDWTLIAKRLNFTQKDINAWQTQADPVMSMLQEWYTINKSSDATAGLIKALKDIKRKDCVDIIEKHLKDASTLVSNPNEADIDFSLSNAPPQIFISYEWGSKDKAILLNDYLKKNNYDCWLDIGQMGGGDVRNQRIDKGLRAAHVLLCLVSSSYGNDETSVRQVNLAVQMNKPIIPIQLDKIKWPPSGSLGPILSEYLFIRFYQKPNEKTNDERYWPVDKFDELIMQLKHIVPSKGNIVQNPASSIRKLVFISYQWDKQKQIIKLYTKLLSIGIACWFDIKEMGGGDSLFEKIDTGIRNCDVMVSCITEKYALSANCRREVSLANSVNKPIIPILLEPKTAFPPKGPMGPVFATMDYIDFTRDVTEQDSWNGANSELLLDKIKAHIPADVSSDVSSNVQIMRNSKACIIS